MPLRLAALLCCFATVLPAQTSSTDPMALVQQGRKLNSEGKQPEALELYKQAIAIAPDLFDAYLQAGIALDLQGDYPAARHHLEKAVELAKTPHTKQQALRTLAMSYAFDHNAKQAIAYDRQIIESEIAAGEFDAAADVSNELARICLESGDYGDARHWYQTGYETALKKPGITPADKGLWTFRWEHAQARLAARQNDSTQAHAHESAAKAIFDKGLIPEQARFVPYLSGYVAYYTGDFKGAVSELQKADQRDPFILVLLAQAYEKTGDKAHAAENYRKIMSFNMHNPTNAFARPLARSKLAQ